jgi:hypothetical protein
VWPGIDPDDVVLLWGGAYVGALLWGLAVEILRTPIYLE